MCSLGLLHSWMSFSQWKWWGLTSLSSTPSTWIVVWNNLYLRLQRSVTAARVFRGLRDLICTDMESLPCESDHKCMSCTSIMSALFCSQMSYSSSLASMFSGEHSINISVQLFRVGYDVTRIITAKAKVHSGSNHQRFGLK